MANALIYIYIWYQLDWWLVWLPSCRLCLGIGGVTECGEWVAGRQQGWGSQGIDPPTHSTVYIVGSGSSYLFLSFLFSSFCWDWGTLAFWQVFSSFLIHPLNLSSCTDRVELLGAVLWPRGRAGAANRGRQALARDLSLAPDLLTGTSTRHGAEIRPITSAFWAIEQ